MYIQKKQGKPSHCKPMARITMAQTMKKEHRKTLNILKKITNIACLPMHNISSRLIDRLQLHMISIIVCKLSYHGQSSSYQLSPEAPAATCAIWKRYKTWTGKVVTLYYENKMKKIFDCNKTSPYNGIILTNLWISNTVSPRQEAMWLILERGL